MIDLFRYIEQSFIVPPANINAIDISDSSDFQNKLLRDLQNEENAPLLIRKDAGIFLDKYASATESTLNLARQYLDFHDQILKLSSIKKGALKELVEKYFNSPPAKLITSDSFKNDKQLLNDLIVAVKIVTRFDKVRGTDLVSMRQSIAFIETISEMSNEILTTEEVRGLLLWPVVVPSAFLKKPIEQPIIKPPPSGDTEEAKKLKELKKEYDSLKAAYNTLMSLRPDELTMTEVLATQKQGKVTAKPHQLTTQAIKSMTTAPKQVLGLTNAVISKFEPLVMKMFNTESIDIKTTGYSELAKAINYKTREIYKRINSCDKIHSATKVYRLGINAFAVKSDPDILSTPSSSTPDFSHAITRPVGIGNLQVVRQELLGYEAKEISHIENILEGEVLRHSTIRSETTEVTISDETQTIQADERDLQSTIRNEMVSESQKESGQQTSSTQDQTSTTSYGKLVENSKSNYAKTVTDRAVSSLSQKVMHQRIQREKKTFTEKSVHEFDNSKQGAKNVTGIYQWVDKKYRNRIMNYGTRLLYDVVVPEPAAFLIESLKNAPQPEGLELIKPDVFDLCPACLNEDNYACLAAKYGVSGSVIPPPEDFIQTVSRTESPVPKANDLFNQPEYSIFMAFSIEIKEGYKAVSGYVQRVRESALGDAHGFEFFIGEQYFNDFSSTGIIYLNHSFAMKGETGQIPVTFRSYAHDYQFNFAIGINCQRTEKIYEQWQLKTHAAIMSGYNRQLAEYQDRLSKFQAIIRTQMANAANYAHNPSIEQAELKKAFIYLLLSEHFNYTYKATPDPEIIPADPVYVKNWGAMVAFFERAFEWENIMYTYYPYFWGRRARWGELILIQDISPQFEEFLKAGAARIVVPVRPGFEAALAHYQETGDVWLGEEIPDIFSKYYVSIIQEIKARNFATGDEVCVAEWDVNLPTTLVMLKADAKLPGWDPTLDCKPIV